MFRGKLTLILIYLRRASRIEINATNSTFRVAVNHAIARYAAAVVIPVIIEVRLITWSRGWSI
jgi:hypothetical protein